MQRILAARRQRAIHIDQILHAADLGAQNNLIRTQPILLRQLRGFERAHHHRFHGHFARVFRLRQARIFVHHARQQRLVERSPIYTNAHRALILHCDFNHDAEVVIILAADAHVAGIDAVLRQALGATRVLRQQKVSVVMEVADDRDARAQLVESLDDVGHSLGGLVSVDSHADHFAARPRQVGNLLDSSRDIRRVGVGHRLHHYWCITADSHSADGGGDSLPASHFSHRETLV